MGDNLITESLSSLEIDKAKEEMLQIGHRVPESVMKKYQTLQERTDKGFSKWLTALVAKAIDVAYAEKIESK
jgi:hypothetical protein